MDQYRNQDGTYTSPRNNKTYKSLKAFIAHWHHSGLPVSVTSRLYNVQCQYCDEQVIVCNRKRHEHACYLNPVNTKLCLVCDNPIRNWKESKGTCSRSCSNKHFRTGTNNGNWNADRYQTTCFLYHKKECVVCGEQNIVAVHHYDENHNNNDPANLIPLCPTHHHYVHSSFKHLVIDKVESYIAEWKRRKLD